MSIAQKDRRREEFPSLDAGIYLLSHSLGPVPLAARDSMLEYTRRWQEHAGEDAWSVEWWKLSEEVGDRIASLIGAGAGTVQIQPTASVAMSVVASCFDFTSSARRKVVTTALDFPSMGYVWVALQRSGADVCVVPSDNDIEVDTQAIIDAIDENTCLVALSHVSYRSSSMVDAPAICERAHKVGARVVLDAYQSVGVRSINVTEWKVDFLIGGSIKWLCGGPSLGYLYVRPDLIEQLEPKLTGWIAHERPFDFAHGAIEYANGIRRFAQGTPNIPGLYSVLPGLKIIQEVGVENIASESLSRTQSMVEFSLAHGWSLHCPVEAARRGGSVMIEVDDPAKMVEALVRRKVYVDCRPGVGLRLSPHFFNTDQEINQAMEILADEMEAHH